MKMTPSSLLIFIDLAFGAALYHGRQRHQFYQVRAARPFTSNQERF